MDFTIFFFANFDNLCVFHDLLRIPIQITLFDFGFWCNRLAINLTINKKNVIWFNASYREIEHISDDFLERVNTWKLFPAALLAEERIQSRHTQPNQKTTNANKFNIIRIYRAILIVAMSSPIPKIHRAIFLVSLLLHFCFIKFSQSVYKSSDLSYNLVYLFNCRLWIVYPCVFIVL